MAAGIRKFNELTHDRPFLLAIGLYIFLMLTNRWLGWSEAIAFMKAFDVTAGYEVIALSAPDFPGEGVASHYAQRFIVPWLLGSLARFLGAELHAVFLAAVFALQIGTLLVVRRIFLKLGSPAMIQALGYCLLILSPYAFRYYLLVPGMVCDLVFVFGAAIFIEALLGASPAALMIGLLVALIGRQTAITLVPGAMGFILLGLVWSRCSKRVRFACALGIPLVLVAAAGCIQIVASTFSRKTELGFVLTGLWDSLFDAQATARILAEHHLRILLPLVPSVVLLAVLTWRRFATASSAWLALIGCSVVAQPYLTGPPTGANAGRLVSLGLVPFVAAIAAMKPDVRRVPAGVFIFAVLALAAGSVHHMVTWIGPSTVAGFLVAQLICHAAWAMAVVAITRKE